MSRVIGLDLSLTGTGLACLHRHGDTVDAAVQKISSKPAGQDIEPRSTRLRLLTQSIVAAVMVAHTDLVVIEGPTYMSDTGHAHDRSGLWWLVMARLTGLGIPVAEVAPTAVKVYATGKGGGKDSSKDQVLAAVVRRYLNLVEVNGNNEADALVLAAMGARHLGWPVEPGTHPQTHTRALAAVRWPTIPTLNGVTAHG